jgi:hypothetical protein
MAVRENNKTSVLLYLPRYRSVDTARPRFDNKGLLTEREVCTVKYQTDFSMPKTEV